MKLFKERMKAGNPLVGTIVSMGLPMVSEMISRCGFDWLWIDMEHAPLSLNEVQGLLQSKAESCAGFVRVPFNDEVWIKRVLDLGADGIIVPQVKTASEASRAVAAAKYPPAGIRSVGLSRANSFGMNFAGYGDTANQDTLVLLQVEHKEGVSNINEILNVSGIDAIIIGPYDLSGSFGKLGQIQDPEVQDAINTVLSACKKRGVPIGIFTMLPEQGRECVERGFQLVATGVDSHFLWTAAKEAAQMVADSAVATTV